MARRRNIVRSARRLSVWVGAGLADTTITSGTQLLLSLNAAALAVRPFTVVRTHLAINYGSDQAIAGESSMAVLSMQVLSDSAIAAGVGSVPTPINETDADYFVYKPIHFDFSLATFVGFEN